MKIVMFLTMLLSASVLMAQELVILHTNDMHSHQIGFAPEMEYTPLVADNDPTLGGFARIAGFIKAEKQQYGDKLLVVDAGDFLMGTLFQTLEGENSFQLNMMKTMGYDFVGLGNHEFDFGTKGLAKILANSKLHGEIPQLLNSNFQPYDDGRDAELAKFFGDGTILPYKIVVRNGYKIGVFALVGLDADEAIATYNDVIFGKAVKCAKKTAKMLKTKEKVDLVVVLSHGGVKKNKKGNYEGEDIKLGKAVPEIDVIVGGHTHVILPKLLRSGNAAIVSTDCNGTYVGKLEISFGADRKPIYSNSVVPMDDKIKADADIQALIESKFPLIEKSVLSKIGVKISDPVFESSFNLELDFRNQKASNLGPLASDAIYNFLNKTYNENIDFSIVASGVLRNNINRGNSGKQNINDVFNIMPLGDGNDNLPGSPIGKIYISGNELKKVMELILTVYPSKEDYYLYFTGMKITCNPDKGLFRKISKIEIGNDQKGYKSVSFSKKDKSLYGLAANKYILSFVANLKKMSFGIVNVVGKRADGTVIKNGDFLIDLDKNKEGIQEAKEWLALYDYLSKMPDVNGNGIPDVPQLYRTKLNPIIETGK